MDSAEFTEWQAMYLVEPFGDAVADQRHGDATAVLANAHFGRPEKHYTASDFKLGDRDIDQSPPESEPEFIDDPIAQSNLIRAAIFGIAPK
jgi:hypothetical protein